jgi:peptide/nickel transport system permease protein
MIQYILRRILQMVPVIFLVTVVIFSITLLLPGDITYTILGEDATEEQRAQAIIDYGLDDPVIIQYFRWLGHALQGDLGRSFRTHQPVIEMIQERFPATLELTLFAMIISVIIGVPAGIIASTKRNSIWDVLATIISMFGVAIPFFWLGILLILLFSLKLGWLPPSGYVPFTTDPIQNLKLMILPSLTVGAAMAAVVMRQTRGAMLNVLNQTYIDTARAKGLSEAKVQFKHALRNAFIPVVTVIGLQTGSLMGGAVVTESVFSISGVGRMVVQGIFNRDYPVVQGGILLIVLCVLVINMLVDVLYAVLDPRIKLS